MRQVKYLIVVCALLLGTMSSFGQSKDDLKKEIEQLKQQNAMLMQMMSNMQQVRQYQNPQQQYLQGQSMMQSYAKHGKTADEIDSLSYTIG